MKKPYSEYKFGDESWREASIIEYSYLVKHISARFSMRLPSSVFFDELVSAGSLGLIDAVDKFDPSKHVSLKTYAQYRIKGAILDELRSMDTYSRSMRKKIQDITKAVKKVEDTKGSTATDDEICGQLGVSLETYYDMLTNIHGASVLSLDEFIKTKKNDSYSQTRFQSGIKGEDNPADCFDKKELKLVLAQTIKTLSKKEQIVVSLYYFDELTLKEIGEVLSLTESRICQIHTAILVKLKARLQDYVN
ncbi:MAG: FliA/WhiG family RNA polymerase sigma factor [Proteobacteria bacterium]|nr:FliA/WhiG family RNA polymerase sigma factor [Pseudomonadota bacterium]